MPLTNMIDMVNAAWHEELKSAAVVTACQQDAPAFHTHRPAVAGMLKTSREGIHCSPSPSPPLHIRELPARTLQLTVRKSRSWLALLVARGCTSTVRIRMQQRMYATDMADMYYSSPEHSDMTLGFGEQEIKAHKIILSQSSEYFRAIFEGDTRDAQSRRLSVQHGIRTLTSLIAWTDGLYLAGTSIYVKTKPVIACDLDVVTTSRLLSSFTTCRRTTSSPAPYEVLLRCIRWSNRSI